MKLSHPFEIAPNLQPGVRIGKRSWVTIVYSPRSGVAGRTRYLWTILPEDAPAVTGDDLQSGCTGGDIREGMASLLAFLSAFAEARTPGSENWDLFTPALREWAQQHSDEIALAAFEVEETADCIEA